jgi:hypothetical protein
MKSYTFPFFTGVNMVNKSSMFKRTTALNNISTQTFVFDRRSYKKGIRRIKMAKAAIVTGPRRRLAVKFFSHSVCPDLCKVCLVDNKLSCSKVIHWTTKVPFSEFSPCTQRDPYVS